ncbi:hypothetical protein ABW636_04720 [Aquimarina sp. 2201CG1-2-11]|uniref:hypothetical protein n=1 Tax=Aquimarina discodermiae TaxID=3231043 RepID=UPI0034629B97
MKKTINFKVIIIKLLIVIGVFSIPLTSYYSFDQTIPGSVLYTLIAISVLGNFYSPLHLTCSSNLDLTVNLSHDEFQPIYITKQNGITESINAKFCFNEKSEIQSIEFEVLKYSGLLTHGISKMIPSITEDGIEFYFNLSFFSPTKKNIPKSCIPQGIQDIINAPSKEPFDIYTKANYGPFHQFRIKLTECICNENCGGFPLNQGGSICNIKCVHTKN